MKKQVTLFSSPSCGPCNALKPILSEVRAQHGFNLTVISASPNTQQEFVTRNVRSVPTIVVLDGETEVARKTGAMSREMLIEFLKEAGAI